MDNVEERCSSSDEDIPSLDVDDSGLSCVVVDVVEGTCSVVLGTSSLLADVVSGATSSDVEGSSEVAGSSDVDSGSS